VRRVEVDEITLAGNATPRSLAVVNGEVVLTSKPDSAHSGRRQTNRYCGSPSTSG
jgi:hypothetical protein